MVALFCLVVILTGAAVPSMARADTVPQSRAQLQLSFAPVAKQAAPAVVNIYTKRKVVDRGLSPFFNDPFFQQFFGERFGVFGMPRERVVSSLGSGVLVDPKGLVVTNFHVIKGADDIIVVLSDRREYSAKVVLRDEQTDLALLSLENAPASLPHLRLRDSDTLEVGDLVLAIGNPFGVGQTVTSGIISATARSAVGVSDFGFFIQTDAAINPGNSGGALVDMRGQLVGVPSAIYTRSGGSNGIGFAIPSNMVQAMIGGQVKNGKVIKPWLGAKYQNITREFADSLGLERNAGVLVNAVIEDSPADEAGLKAGDVILAFDGKPIDDMQALRFRTAITALDAPVRMEIIRDGRPRTLNVRLALPPENPPRETRTLEGRHPLNGVEVSNLNPALAIELGLDPSDRGVVIVSDGRRLKAGDIIETVNGRPVTSTRELERLLKGNAEGWSIEFRRGENVFTLRIVR